ncbi:hypothetical protein KJF94_16970 [Pseudomonas hormoni]|uniref:Uncharacterized protein n=1 Tax=Pseudomonas hormoni TaxID=3093767 RepID=A0ABX8EQL9_9PSED|nr:hypothetical protein [Pseudomonas hormoni]QVW21600.1 hypothetical protein KJF94_16970 [Pseudomonas hormoni]
MPNTIPQLSKAELAHALRELKGFSADLDTQSGYDASAVLLAEIMADPIQRDRLVALLEQFEEEHPEHSATGWVNDGLPVDRTSASPVSDDLYYDLPTGTEDTRLSAGSAGATVEKFLSKYREEMVASLSYGTCMSPETQYVLKGPVSECFECTHYASFDVDAWSRVLVLAEQRLQGEATRRTSFLSRLAQVFHENEPPEWEVQKCPITENSFLIILNHGADRASIGFVGSEQSAFVMVSINDSALTINESFQNTQKFAARIADFFTDAPKSGHKAIQHMLRAL